MTTTKPSSPVAPRGLVMNSRLEARWRTPVGDLKLAEPSDEEVARAARELAEFYNDPHNSALLSNTHVFSPDEVERHWRDARADGGRAFLFTRDGALVGDGDFRHLGDREAELALLIGPRSLQGMGLGRRFALMLLALGYGNLGLQRVYVAIRPQNAGSLRLFERVGFVRDETPAARAYAEDDDDVCMVLGKGEFFARHGDAVREESSGWPRCSDAASFAPGWNARLEGRPVSLHECGASAICTRRGSRMRAMRVVRGSFLAGWPVVPTRGVTDEQRERDRQRALARATPVG